MKLAVMGTGQGLGGLHTHLQRLLRFLVAEGHDTTAFIVADAGQNFEIPPGVREGGRLAHSSAGTRQKLAKWLALRRLEAAVRRLSPDVFVAAATGRAYARVARTARDGGAFSIWQEVVLPARGDALHAEMSRSVDVVAVQTPSMLPPFLNAISEARLAGCLPCFFEPPMTERVACGPGRGEEIRLAYFGRLAGNKGLVPFLDVFRDVANDSPIRLDIHGGGEQRDAIARKVDETGLRGRVELRGRYPDGKKFGDLLTSYHGLVLPSIDCEGLPLVLLEAMGCGLPFLATNIGGIADVAVENPDVIVVPPDASSLRAGLRSLLENLRTGAISNSRLKAYATERFSNEKFAESWRAMLKDPRAFFAPHR